MRAIAITGVVYWHASAGSVGMPNIDFWSQHFFVLSRFLLSFIVALFVFLAGYFSTISYQKSNTLVFWKKRFMRLGVPYLFWSMVYVLIGIIVYDQIYSYRGLIGVFGLGRARVPFYFFIVLFQFVLLTPLLFAWAKKRTLMWLPHSISFLYLICFRGIFCTGGMTGTLFVPWLALYWSGMLCNLYESEIHGWLARRKKLLVWLTTVSYLFFLGGLVYFFHTQEIGKEVDQTLAFKHWTAFTFIPVNLLMFMLFLYRRTVIRNRLVLFVGSSSYGIFLIHVLFLEIISRISFLKTLTVFPVPYALIVTAAALIGSVFTIWLGRKILGEKKAAWIGF